MKSRYREFNGLLEVQLAKSEKAFQKEQEQQKEHEGGKI
jgi:hypothetical protein